jgi:hypothetical protein
MTSEHLPQGIPIKGVVIGYEDPPRAALPLFNVQSRGEL